MNRVIRNGIHPKISNTSSAMPMLVMNLSNTADLQIRHPMESIEAGFTRIKNLQEKLDVFTKIVFYYNKWDRIIGCQRSKNAHANMKIDARVFRSSFSCFSNSVNPSSKEEVERAHIKDVYASKKFNLQANAEVLGISQDTLRRILIKCNLYSRRRNVLYGKQN